MNSTIFVGLDVHKVTVSVAVAKGTRGGKVRSFGTVAHRAEAIKSWLGGSRLSFSYEAGPCRYGLYRQLTALGHECMVVTPSLISIRAGDRLKTDWRDAVLLTGCQPLGCR